jgi:hypothetical protein
VSFDRLRHVETVAAGQTTISVSIGDLPDRRRQPRRCALVRVRIATDDNAMSVRLGPVGAARLVAALERGIAEAWGEHDEVVTAEVHHNRQRRTP